MYTQRKQEKMDSDMTKYCYQHYENAYNIGWNVDCSKMAEKQAPLSQVFLEKLARFCENPLNRDLNGIHRNIEVNGKKYAKGFGEIRIIDLKKKIRYAAPNVIVDDILNEKYTPPLAFIEAVLAGPSFDSEEYQEFYREYSENNFWGETKENCKKIERAVLLLENNFDNFKNYVTDNGLIDIVTRKGSLLNYAIITEKEREALWLIEHGIDINTFDGLELLTAIKKNSDIIAKALIDKEIIVDGREMKDNPLVNAIRFSNTFLVEELMKKYPNLIVTYSNEYVWNCTVLDIAYRTKNEEVIRMVKKYLVSQM